MGTPGPLHRLCLAAVAVLAVVAGCTQRPAPPHGPRLPHRAPAAPPSPTASAPVLPPPTPATPLADAERDANLFTVWRSKHDTEVARFEEFLVQEQLAQVVPTYQLLRSASMWKECRAEPFQLPPPVEWPRVREVLVLLQELKQRGVLSGFEVVSAYRDPRLNRCAGGAPGSSHQHFAVDIAPVPEPEGERLCRFWRDEGQAWDMGLSRYPSGRIHIDRTAWRTWGASHKRGSSYCLD